jgi:molybdopterin converting factor small subunit
MLRIRFDGILRQIAGCAGTNLELPASRCLGDVLETLDQTYPGILGNAAEYQWRHGSSHVIVAVNGKLVEEDAGEICLADGDQVTLLPPIGGG